MSTSSCRSILQFELGNFPAKHLVFSTLKFFGYIENALAHHGYKPFRNVINSLCMLLLTEVEGEDVRGLFYSQTLSHDRESCAMIIAIS